MNDKSNVFFVDSHAKSNGSDDHLNFILHPRFLNLLPIAIVQFRVVEIAFDFVIPFKYLSKLFTFFSAYTVDDA